MGTTLLKTALAGVVTAVTMLLAGCAVTGVYPKDFEPEVKETKAFLDRIAQIYRVRPVSLVIGEHVEGFGATYTRGTILLNVKSLKSANRDALLAHEMTHYILGHAPITGLSIDDLRRQQQERERETNIKSVEVLARAKEVSEYHALIRVYAHLHSFLQLVKANRTVVPSGHKHPCEEISDLVMAYPQYRDRTQGLECAPTEWVAVRSPQPDQVDTTMATHLPTSEVAAPVWKRGDEWVYRWESAKGNGIFAWSVDRVEAVDGAEYYVVKSGQRREIYWRTADLAYLMDKVDGQVETRQIRLTDWSAWPLSVGKSWEMHYREERPQQRQSTERQSMCQAEAEESVRVPAGEFSTIRIVCRDKRTGRATYEVWYSPKVKQWVRERTHFSDGIRQRELLSFTVR